MGVSHIGSVFGQFNCFFPIIINTVSELFVQVKMQLEELGDKFKDLTDQEIQEDFKKIIQNQLIALE